MTDTASASTATCLGCGCVCDDIEIVQREGRIVDARRACALGAAWFGDGSAPARITLAGQDASLAAALDAAATLAVTRRRTLVYLAPDLSCEAQRAAAALADALGATLDSITSATALPAVLAAQERGRAAATLGELRQRADAVIFWGVDPADRYPRFAERYVPEPVGLHVGGRGARTVVAVDIDGARGPADADLRVAVPARDEVAILTALAAIVRLPQRYASTAAGQPEHGRGVSDVEGRGTRPPGPQAIEEPAVPAAGDRPAPEVTAVEQQTAGPPPTAGEAQSADLPTEAAIEPAEEARPDVWATAQRLASALAEARYIAIVADAEPAGDPSRAHRAGESSDPGRAAALIALAQTLNGPARAALVTLRAGGNRSGADAVLTWQTGYPAAVDLARGYPRYRPADGTAGARLARGEIDFAVVLGSSAFIPERIMSIMSRIPCVAIGPRASEGPLAGAAVVIDSGVAGIHEGGMAFRMDDVPLPLPPVVAGPPAAALVVEALVERVVRGGIAAAPTMAGTTGSGESVQ